MPRRNIYVKTKHLPLFAQAEKEGCRTNTSVSHIIVRALRLYLKTVAPMEEYFEGPGSRFFSDGREARV